MPEECQPRRLSLLHRFSRNPYFRQRVVYPYQLPSIMRKHIYTGAMGNVWATLVSGTFFVYFGTQIGISRFGWGIMAGLSSWLIGAQIVSAMLVQRTGQRKLIWFCFSVGERGLRMAGILIALWMWHDGVRGASAVLIAAICLANFLGTMASPPWLSWFADIIPEDQHGTFWGRRVGWISLSVVGVVLPAAWMVDRIPSDGNLKLYAVTAVFGLATLIGLADLLIHGTIPEPIMDVPPQRHLLRDVLAPLRDRTFRPWLVFNFCWTLSMTLGGVLATLYFVDELEIKNNFLGGMVVLTTLSLVGCTLTGRWSGRLVDQAGLRRVLYWGHVAWGILPTFWIFATPQTALVWLGLGSLVGGTSSTAAITASTKLVTRYPEQADCAMYVAVSSSVGSFAGGIGVMIAGTLLRALEGWTWQAWGWTFGAFHLLFIASAVLRLLSAHLLIPRIPDPGIGSDQPA